MRQLKRSGADPSPETPLSPGFDERANPFRPGPGVQPGESEGTFLYARLTRETAAEAVGFDPREKSYFLGVAHFFAAVAFYAATLAGVYLADALAAKILLSAVNGLAIGILFVVGHDACHGALTPGAALNKWIARLAFLPSLHTYSAWFYGHNVLHHGWTNLKGRDPVYAPKSVEEFRALSPFARLRERAYRSLPGVGLLYLHTIWIDFEILPSKRRRDAISRYGDFEVERAIVLLFLAMHLGLVFHFSTSLGAATVSALLGVAIPFLVWNWLMGFVTYLHHMHPSIRWFDSVRDWSFGEAQLKGSAHVEFPGPLDFILMRIMQHTAHHICAEIPLYRLNFHQAKLDDEAVKYGLSLDIIRDIFANCQLYDFKNQKWLKFSAARLR